MNNFRTPRRRLTRQKSGFKVSGDKKGSTCKIVPTFKIFPTDNKITLKSSLKELYVPTLFTRNIGIIGTGFYFNPNGKCKITGSINWICNGLNCTESIPIIETQNRIWHKHGILIEIPLNKSLLLHDIVVDINIFASDPVDFFGLIIGAITHPYLIKNDVYKAFSEQTSIYIPEILFIDPVNQSVVFVLQQGRLSNKEIYCLVCKSCNRCGRFLPIDILFERNTLSYSNHCVSRAPCIHSSFSRYRIEDGSAISSSLKVDANCVVSHYGHQLECKVCKKFFVNMPLNPKRDSTQHREDSLRRRALEVLVNQLLGCKWIYHHYRLNKRQEFDIAIWERFGKKCFNCGIEILSPNRMHLDHTLPLSYLWPLDETATCLCNTCNSSKSDKFPVDFYPTEVIPLLSELTKIDVALLKSRPINEIAVKELFNKIEWFFDIFLNNRNYQKIRKGKKAADLILNSLHNVLHASGVNEDLIKLYKEKTKKFPGTVTIN
jgi:hypothetical protein